MSILDVAPTRFWKKVDRSSACWTWQGGTAKGYGLFWFDGRTVAAHRFLYERVIGPVPQGHELDHVCRNRACVNPDHLRAVDHRTNVLAGVGQSAQNAARTHCPKGHPYVVQNRGGGRGVQRICQTCRNARHAGYAQSKAEAVYAAGRAGRMAARARMWGETAE